jgi:hypothetical protein
MEILEKDSSLEYELAVQKMDIMANALLESDKAAEIFSNTVVEEQLEVAEV